MWEHIKSNVRKFGRHHFVLYIINFEMGRRCEEVASSNLQEIFSYSFLLFGSDLFHSESGSCIFTLKISSFWRQTWIPASHQHKPLGMGVLSHTHTPSSVSTAVDIKGTYCYQTAICRVNHTLLFILCTIILSILKKEKSKEI